MSTSSSKPSPLLQPVYNGVAAMGQWTQKHPKRAYGLSVGVLGLGATCFAIVKAIETFNGIGHASTTRSVFRAMAVALAAIASHDLCRSSFNIVHMTEPFPYDGESLMLPNFGTRWMEPSYFSWTTWVQIFFSDEERSKIFHRGNILLDTVASAIIAYRLHSENLDSKDEGFL